VRFPGILPAVTTPFDDRGDVDVTALERNIAWLLDAGVHGIVGTGTVGEAGALSAGERRRVLEAIVGVCAGQVPVVAGVSSPTPAASIDHATDAASTGVDGLMLLPPLLYRGDDREIEHFFRTVAEAVGLPLMVYNNPEASGTDLPPALIARLGERIEQVVAVKECSGDVRRIPALLHAGGGLEILVGGDDWALEGLCAGATGWVTGVADVAPHECVALFEHCRAGELEPARELYRRMLPLARFDMTPKLVQYFKAALDEVGQAGGATRPPRLALTDAEHDDLRTALRVLRQEVPAG